MLQIAVCEDEQADRDNLIGNDIFHLIFMDIMRWAG